ncbi:GEVED domain-containing protein [Flavobacterium sp.]|jgi:hypothetical protein|uniref:GEVED domain-containing protein n=1 Tax=Flavobacterium sp. TaxID=239 RepID=UPI0037BFB8DA
MNHFYKSFTTSRSVYNTGEQTTQEGTTAFFKKFRLIAFLFLLLPCTMSWGQTTIWSDNFDASSTSWTVAGNFSVGVPGTSNVVTAPRSSAKILATVIDGTYANSCAEASNYAVSPAINCSSYSSVTLKYYSYSIFEQGYDYGRVYYSINNGSTWLPSVEQVGATLESGYTLHTVSLPSASFVSQVKIKFTMYSDSSTRKTGWNIDDLAVVGTLATSCSGTPSPGNTIASVNPVVSGSSTVLSLQNATTGSGVTYQWQSSADNSSWNNVASGGTSSSYTATPTTATYYRCNVTCSGNTGTSAATQVTLTYCTPVHSAGTSALTNVTLNTINNTTTSASPYYSIETVTTNLYQNSSYLLSISTSTDSSIVSVWIDWNNNFIFDTNEWTQVYSSGYSGSITLNVPSSALGSYKMRIRSRNTGSQNGSSDACSSFGSGETEDYTITVIQAPACSGTPTPGTIASNATQNICSGATPAALTVTGTTSGVTGISFQWEQSTDNASWTNASGGTGATTASYTPPSFGGTTIYYRCKVTCTNSSSFDVTNTATIAPPANPTTQASSLAFSSVSYTGFTATWTNGNGNRRVVYISDTAITDPTNITGAAALTANTTYSGSGQQIVYDGTGTSVAITGLTLGSTYYVEVFEYAICGTTTFDYFYNTTAGTNATTVTTSSITPVPWSESFAVGATLTNWLASADFFVSSSITALNPAISSNYAYVNLDGAPITASLITPIIGSIPSNYRFVVKYKLANYSSPYSSPLSGSGNFIVAVSTNNGTSYTDVVTVANNTLSGWQDYLLNLSAYAGQNIRIRLTGNYISGDYYLAFDDFSVEAIPAPTITNVASSVACGTTSSVITITGTGLANATSVKVGGTTISPLTTNTDTQIIATVSTTISGTVEVTSSGGTATSSGSVSFTVAPALTLNSTTQDNCSGVTNNTVTTLTSTAADYDTYTWSPSTGVSGDATNGWTFNPTATTTYTLTASNAGGCSRTLTKTVTVNAVPSTVTVSPSSAIVEPATVTTLTATGGTISATATGTVGAGTLVTSDISQPTAFCNRWRHYWHQTVFTAAELNAAGIQAGNITAIKFNITAQGSANTVTDFKVRIGTTSNNTLSSFQTTGLTQVFNLATYNITIGVNTITFDTPYVWDGVSNILLDVRQTGADSLYNTTTYYTTTSGNTVVYATTSTQTSSDSFAGTNPTALTSTNRLNTTFVCNSSIATTVTWSPTTDLYTDSGATTAYTGGAATTVYAKPTATTTYTATATSGAGCSASGTAQINVANMWTGNTSNSWSTASNWSASAVPTSSDNIIISSNGSNSPVLDVDLTIPSGKSLTLSGSDTTLTIAAGKTLTVAGTVDFGGKSVVFKSDNSGTAALAQITGTLTGATNVTVERYIPAKRGWRLLTAPLKGSTSNTIGTNWQGTANEGLLLFSPATYQTQTMTGYTTGGSSPNIWKYNSANTQWQSIPAISTENLFSSTVNNGFLVFATGSHGSNTIASSTTAESTTLKPKGQLITGSVTHTLTANKYHLLGNPYASPINTQTMVQANAGTTIYMVDPTIGTGGYVVFDGSYWTPSTPSGSNMYLQSGQGFFLKSTAGGTFTIAETHKTSGNSNTWFERTTTDTSTDKIRVLLYKQINTTWQLADGILAVNSASGNHDLDAIDVGKMNNFNENLLFKNGASNLAIEYRGLPAAGTLQPLQLTGTSAQGYELRIKTENYSNSNLTPYLENTQTGALTPIPTDGSEVIVPFTGIAATSAAPDSRFRIVYQAPLSADDMNNLVVGVYPNPVQEGLFTIELANTNAPASYTLTNLLGQEVQKGTLMSLTNAIAVQDLSQGVYLLQINQESKRFTTKLMIK